MTTAVADDTTTTTDTKTADTKTADTTTADSKTAIDTTTDKTVDGTKADATTQGDQKAVEPQVPESYALTLPDRSPLVAADLDRFKTEAKAMGMTNAQAQKYVESRHTELVAAIAQLNQEGADLKADPDLGGAKWDATVKHVARGVKEFFGTDEPDAKAFIDRLGLGNNKLLVRAFARFGAKFNEDSPVSGSGGAAAEPTSLADRLYGKPKA